MLRLGFENRAPIYDTDDTDLAGRPRKDAKPIAFALHRDPTVDEQLSFNRAYVAAAQKKDEDETNGLSRVLYDYGLLILTGVEGVESANGLDPLEAFKTYAHQQIITLAQRVFVRGKAQLDLGKSAASEAPTSEEVSVQ